ncbi:MULTISPECIES: hypothetical protein [Bacillus]|uniref:hypothetical protein n=1 Tax=Bacillus TaxID=1386 RepID=UPI000985A47D|nr:hypothetical protein [Bacillus pseudomycoides]OOG90918.1 hypothetical protein BTH41_02401 [Bacillus mycoides]PEK64667.1 hypothetical protein CN590_19785 [Bacillus pseudomycoides]PEL31764.1 hypothetical protein CN608_06675 [Bacillus pseudomycoides]PGE89170.1 hypothetical protein COM55_00275 [Bacillus pseudomycoides]
MSLNDEDNFLEEETTEEDDDEGIELKTITIAEYVKQQRERRKQEQQVFEDKLKVLKERTERLKKELGYK